MLTLQHVCATAFQTWLRHVSHDFRLVPRSDRLSSSHLSRCHQSSLLGEVRIYLWWFLQLARKPFNSNIPRRPEIFGAGSAFINRSAIIASDLTKLRCTSLAWVRWNINLRQISIWFALEVLFTYFHMDIGGYSDFINNRASSSVCLTPYCFKISWPTCIALRTFMCTQRLFPLHPWHMHF